MLAPHDPPYGYNRALSSRLLIPARLGLEQKNFTVFVSMMRNIAKVAHYSVLLCTHRAVTPYLFDAVTTRPTIVHGDAHFERTIVSALHIYRDMPPVDPRRLIEDLYYENGTPNTSRYTQAPAMTFATSTEQWFWTERQRREIAPHFPEKAPRIEVLPPFIDCAAIDRVVRRSSPRYGRPLLFTTTSSAPSDVLRKGLSPLIVALERLPDVRLRVVLNDYRAVPAELSQLGSRVEVVAGVSKDEMLAIYADLGANCRVSAEDTAPVSVLESMATGLPTIVSPLIAENILCIADGVNAFVVPPTDINELANRLHLLYADSEAWTRMSTVAALAVRKHSIAENLARMRAYSASQGDRPAATS